MAFYDFQKGTISFELSFAARKEGISGRKMNVTSTNSLYETLNTHLAFLGCDVSKPATARDALGAKLLLEPYEALDRETENQFKFKL